MTSLIDIRPASAGLPSFLAEALPYAYDEAGRVQFKGMPGVVWIRDPHTPNGRGFWRGPREAIEVVAATLESAGVLRVRSSLPSPPVAVPDVAGGRLTAELERLRDYQRDGVSWVRWQLQHSGAALLADEMGLGKTPQAIVALDAPGRLYTQAITICPAVVVPHWQTELTRWRRPDGPPWAVGSYGDLVSALSDKPRPKDRRRAAELDAFRAAAEAADAIVLDELHYASDPKAQRSKAIAALRALRPQALCIGLTGTPMTTRPRDLWHPLELLWPARFGRAYDFQARYCAGHYEDVRNAQGALVTTADGDPLKPVWVCDGISRPEELRARLAHVMLRRTKMQVGAELPPRTRIIHEVTLPATARRGLRQAAGALDLTAARSGVSALLAHSETYKIDAAEALARDVMASGGRPLLLTTRRESAHELGRRLDAPSVTGEDAAGDRRARIADAPAAAATLYSVETGINLTGFDCIIFVGLDWVPSRILQGEARIHRIGQDKPCTIYYLIARGTVDEVIQQRVIERLDAFAAITGSAGDEVGLSRDLAPETEDDLIAAIVAAVKEAA